MLQPRRYLWLERFRHLATAVVTSIYIQVFVKHSTEDITAHLLALCQIYDTAVAAARMESTTSSTEQKNKHNYEGIDMGEGRLDLPKRVTASREGRAWFARGWMHILNFNHEEALECFRRCIEVDDQCAMALWGTGENLSSICGATAAPYVPLRLQILLLL